MKNLSKNRNSQQQEHGIMNINSFTQFHYQCIITHVISVNDSKRVKSHKSIYIVLIIYIFNLIYIIYNNIYF